MLTEAVEALLWEAEYIKTARRSSVLSEEEMKFRPLQDRIVIKPLTAETKTSSGIIIPDSAQEKPVEGEVIAIGNGRVLRDGKLSKPDLNAGDRVLYSKYTGTEIKLDGVEHLILRESEILAVLVK
jgi:chaperonin GroES